MSLGSTFSYFIIASDHAGFERKKELIHWLLDPSEGGLTQSQIADMGVSDGSTPVDYPDFADLAVEKYRSLPPEMREKTALVLICGSGVGISIQANRHSEIRAVLAYSENVATLAREHNDANALCLGGRTQTTQESLRILKAFLQSQASKEPRHRRRIEKLSKLR